MIRYALVCAKGHSFESWFANSSAYDRQAKRGLVECPVCGDAKVEKALMAPKVTGSKKRGRAPAGPAIESPAPAGGHAELDVFSDRHRGDEREVLMDHPHTREDRISRHAPRDSPAVHQELPCIRAYHPERDSHQRRLARAVLTEQCVDGTGVDGERHAVECANGSESFENPS